MTHGTYTQQQLQLKSIARLKEIYSQIGATVEVIDKRCKDAWVNAITAHQSSQLHKVDEQAIAQAELELHIEAQAQTVAPEEFTVVEISFYEHEIYCASKLIATITYDDNHLTQRWVAIVNGTEVFRRGWWQKCFNDICWHYKRGTLLPAPTQSPATVEEIPPAENTIEITTAQQPLVEWDFSIPKWNSPAAICPTCNGVGCGNCNYHGIRAVDLCQPQDDYRLHYLGRTDIQTAYNVYKGDDHLGIVFRVRNSDCFWENDPATYYWLSQVSVKNLSIKDTIESLESGKAHQVHNTVSPKLDSLFGSYLEVEQGIDNEGINYAYQTVHFIPISINKSPELAAFTNIDMPETSTIPMWQWMLEFETQTEELIAA
ncbi:hypothetical protein WKK05_39795 (plasmid) [Nostoc sp. UHCC 0302]|uniref:hypothetical protein n=1 Tax=Nostoc sp. UHCC 0302 TaxID=3134896 RepID=UPI00311CD64B